MKDCYYYERITDCKMTNDPEAWDVKKLNQVKNEAVENEETDSFFSALTLMCMANKNLEQVVKSRMGN